MIFSKIFFIIISVSLVSCEVRKYDYFKLSKFRKNNYQLDINSKKYNLSNIIPHKGNVFRVKIDRKNKIVLVQTIEKPEFITLKSISDSIKNDYLNFTVIYGLPFFKETFADVFIEKKAIDSLNVLKWPTSCNASEGLIIRIKD